MVEYEIVISDDSADDVLNHLMKQNKQIRERGMNRIGHGVVGWIQRKKLSGQVLKRQSGALANSMQFRLLGEDAIMVGPGMVYGAAHEFGIPLSAGNYIYPSRGKALRFQYKGATIFAKRVRQHVVKRPYVAPGIREYFQSGAAERTIDNLMKQEFEKGAR